MTRMQARMARTPTPRVAARQESLRAIIEASAPLTVRRAFYIAVGEGVYPNLDPWDDLPCRLAVTVESDGLALALFEQLADTPLRIVAVRGNGSSSAVASLADWLGDAPDEAVVLHVGDADGQGIAIEEDLRSRLALHADRLGGPEPAVERLWLSREQAADHGLPSRPAKLTPMDIKYGFLTECWEAEAGDPGLIADLIRARADALLDADVLAVVAERERVGHEAFAELARRLEAA